MDRCKISPLDGYFFLHICYFSLPNIRFSSFSGLLFCHLFQAQELELDPDGWMDGWRRLLSFCAPNSVRSAIDSIFQEDVGKGDERKIPPIPREARVLQILEITIPYYTYSYSTHQLFPFVFLIRFCFTLQVTLHFTLHFIGWLVDWYLGKANRIERIPPAYSS